MVAPRAKNHRGCHVEMKRMVDFQRWKPLKWRCTVNRWLSNAVPPSLQWDPMSSNGTDFAFLVSRLGPVPKCHTAETLPPNLALVAHVGSAHMIPSCDSRSKDIAHCL